MSYFRERFGRIDKKNQNVIYFKFSISRYLFKKIFVCVHEETCTRGLIGALFEILKS